MWLQYFNGHDLGNYEIEEFKSVDILIKCQLVIISRLNECKVFEFG